jgi:catechol 2,3-dioxygenase-like lactoylglutathione lyase family enzyme
MKSAAILALCFATILPLARSQSAPDTGILTVAGMRLYASDLRRSRAFYAGQLGLPSCQSDAALCFQVNPVQSIELDSADARGLTSQLESVSFRVKNAATLRDLLIKRGLHPTGITNRHGRKFFWVQDPAAHRLQFVQYSRPMSAATPASPRVRQVSKQIIHVGYVVPDRSSSDRFFRDVLAFRPYWHGGMKDGVDDWVALQVPDGTVWIEFMLNVSPGASHRTLGVMNHIALGVTDIQAAKARLLKNGWIPGEEPQMGRDGKWQLNVYDPDDTRIEFMEFTPKEKPCCSDFTGPHPKP